MPILRRSLELMPPDYSIRPRLYRGDRPGPRIDGPEGRGAGGLPRRARAVPRSSRRLLFLEASLLHDQGDEAGRRGTIAAAPAAPSGQQLAAGDAGRRGYKARHLLAEVYRCQDRQAEAEAQWRLVVAEQPRFAPAWQGLGELYLDPGAVGGAG